ncbi:MAG TPA: asparagine synthase-related protein [Methanofastidiosum sp.]|nr:asparagine synthase-related protein [Methanofastidiosum sp.]HQM95179.1 asparagine synthase-related protein [Methanofastidiosum sp.]
MYSESILFESLAKSVSESIENNKETAISFSGGVDSFIVAALAKEYSNPTLYTIGGKNSLDVLYSKIASETLGVPLKIIDLDEQNIIEGINKTKEIIDPSNNFDVLIGVTFFLIAKKIHDDGFHICLSGQGADELFYGYDKYRRALIEGKDPTVLRNKDVQELNEILENREFKIFRHFNIDFFSPFLDEKVKKIGMEININENLKGEEDIVRKHTLREIALKLGAPKEIANRRKKAMQYGSGILEEIRRISKKKGFAPSLNAYLDSIKIN